MFKSRPGAANPLLGLARREFCLVQTCGYESLLTSDMTSVKKETMPYTLQTILFFREILKRQEEWHYFIKIWWANNKHFIPNTCLSSIIKELWYKIDDGTWVNLNIFWCLAQAFFHRFSLNSRGSKLKIFSKLNNFLLNSSKFPS